MNEEEIALVRSTWADVVPISDQAAVLFYDRLFELDPSLRSLFSEDMTEQRQKLMQTIGVAVGALDRLETVLPVVQDLGRNHVTYGVEPAHYETVGEALLWTLGQGLGEKFTPEAKSAWTKTYVTLADVMKEAAAAA